MTDQQLGYLEDVTHLLGDRRALEDFWNEHGYIFLKGAFDTARVTEVRGRLIEAIKSQGVHEEAVNREGFTLKSQEHVNLDAIYADVDIDDFWNSNINVLKRVLGVEPFIYKSTVIRFTAPLEPPTIAHQDGSYIPGDFRSLWVALNHVTREVGGLVIAEGSHKRGLLEHVPLDGTSYTAKIKLKHVPLEVVKNHEWLTTDYEPGDALIFHPFTVHWALPNCSTTKTVRLSADTRFQAADAPRGYFAITPTPELRSRREAAEASSG
jgi:1-deoxypentalenic acid 11beta-hydroxylase